MKPRVYRAAVSTYVVFAVMFGPFMVAPLFRWRDLGARQIFALVAVAAVFCFTWIARFRIVITEEMLYFRSLFRSAQVPRIAIRSAHVRFRASASGGPLRLVVKYDGGGEIDINAKVFSREAIEAVLSLGT
ncbi:MAG TPA: hypothetical protein VGJ81_16610 [Thermoanaerobaculia bacterium]